MATASRVRNNEVTQVLGRFGMVCFGVVHLLIAWLAVQVVFGDSEQTDQKGAIESVAQTPLGPVLLWALAIGLFAYALWQVLLAITGYGWVDKKRKRIIKKISAAVHGVVGAALAVFTIQLVTGSGSSSGSGNEQPRELTARLLELPAGRFLVGIAALAVLAVAFAAIRKGVKRKFLEDLDTARLPGKSKTVTARLGTTGYCAKGAAYAVIGILLGLAAFDSDAGKAGGLDAALKTLQGQPFGSVLLTAVALGFAAFGVYCFAAAKAHR